MKRAIGMGEQADIGAHPRHPYRTPGGNRDEASTILPTTASRTSRLAALLLITFAVVGGWLALIAWHERQLTRAVRSLPPDVQEATYRRSYEELATTCATQPTLADHCSDEAEFILRFPQCRSDCEQLARRYSPTVRK